MTVTIPALWEQQLRRQVRPGGKVMDDADHDLLTLTQRTTRCAAYNARQILGQGGSNDEMIDESATSSETTRYYFAAKPGRTSLNTRLKVYGKDVIARLYIGGVLRATCTCTTTLGWFASASVALTGLTLGADGEVEGYITVQRRVALGTEVMGGWVLEETPLVSSSSLPSGESETEYQRVDDSRIAADRPLSGWLVGTTVRNAREVQRWRCRGTGLSYPVPRVPYVSAMLPRCDGPYVLVTEPWVETIEVLLTVANPSLHDVRISAFTEADLETSDVDSLVTEREQPVAVGSGVVTLSWTGLRSAQNGDDYALNRVWLAIRSDVDSSATTTVTIGDFHDSGVGFLEFSSGNISAASISNPTGWALRTQEQDARYPTTEKGGTTGDVGEVWYDLAEQPYTGGAFALVSPSPRLDGHALPSRDAGLAMTADLYAIGRVALYGVWINGAMAAPSSPTAQFQAECAVGAVPPGSELLRAVRRVNHLAVYGTPMIGIRHTGQREYGDGSSGIAAFDVAQRGRYTFCLGDGSTWFSAAVWHLPTDPTSGSASSSRLDIDEIRAQFDYLLWHTAGWPEDTRAWLEARLVVGATTGDTVDWRAPLRRMHDTAQTVTEWDAGAAAVSAPRDTAPAPDVVYEHAYAQQLAWQPDVQALRSGGLYLTSGLITVDLPASFPATLDLQVRMVIPPTAPAGLYTRTWIAVPSAWAHYGPRRTP